MLRHRSALVGLSLVIGLMAAALPRSASAATPTISGLASSLNPSYYTQRVILTASVAPAVGSGTPTGTETFTDGTTVIAVLPLDQNGQATLVLDLLAAGDHPFTAAYSGDATFAPAIASLLQTVNPTPTVTNLSASASRAAAGTPVTLTSMTTAPGRSVVPTGSVTISDGSTTVAQGSVDASGMLTARVILCPGRHALTATFTGNPSGFASSSSATVTVVVRRGEDHDSDPDDSCLA